jgi:hypothetical protein
VVASKQNKPDSGREPAAQLSLNEITLRFVMKKWLVSLCMVLVLSGCATRFSDQNASGYRQLDREECVPYARNVSGIQLRGNANTWWDKASGVYQRGALPAPGALLVLTPTSKLPSGHLAVVKDLVGPREINVTHTNWGNDWMSRRIVYESMRVQDASPMNDWTSVRFWNREANVFGFPYPVQGFIYPVREQNRPQPVY